MARPKKTVDAAAKEAVAKTADTKTEEVKTTPEASVEEVKEEAPKKTRKSSTKKTTTKKTAATKKSDDQTTTKTTRKKAAVKESVHVQFAGKSYTTEELIQSAKDVWVYDLNQKIEDFQSVELYVKPEENRVYYVINGDVTDSFAI